MNQMNQSHHSMMGLTSHLSDACNAFSSFCFSFFYVPSLTMTTNLTNQMIMDQAMSSLSVRAFCSSMLNYVMIESFLVESQYL